MPFDQQPEPTSGRINLGAFGNTEFASKGSTNEVLVTRTLNEPIFIRATNSIQPLVWAANWLPDSLLVNVEFSGDGGTVWEPIVTNINVYQEYIIWTNVPFYNSVNAQWRVISVGDEYSATNTGQIVTFDHETDFFFNEVRTVDGLTRVRFRGAWDEAYQVEYTPDGLNWTNAPFGAGADQNPLIGPEDRGGDFFYQDVESGTNRFRSYRVRWMSE